MLVYWTTWHHPAGQRLVPSAPPEAAFPTRRQARELGGSNDLGRDVVVLVGSYGVIWDPGPSIRALCRSQLMILVLSQLYLRTSWALNYLIPTMANKISKPN